MLRAAKQKFLLSGLTAVLSAPSGFAAGQATVLGVGRRLAAAVGAATGATSVVGYGPGGGTIPVNGLTLNGQALQLNSQNLTLGA